MSDPKSPFSGGSDNDDPNKPQAPLPAWANLFTGRSKQSYVIDPMGTPIAMTFDFYTTTVTFKVGDTVLTFPFIKV